MIVKIEKSSDRVVPKLLSPTPPALMDGPPPDIRHDIHRLYYRIRNVRPLIWSARRAKENRLPLCCVNLPIVYRRAFTLTLHVEEHLESAGTRASVRSQMFSRTNKFQFDDQDNGFLQTRTATVDARGTRLSLVRSTGHSIDLTEINNISILMPMVGSLNVATHDSEFSCLPGEALLFGPNSRKTRTSNDGDRLFEANVILLPLNTLSDAGDRAATRIADSLLQSGIRVSVSDELCAPFLKYCDFFCTAFSNESAAVSDPRFCESSVLLLGELYQELVSGLSDRVSAQKVTTPGARHVVRAEEYMRANLDRPVAISEVAAAIGISQRSLQLAFQEVRDASPRKVLAMMRLAVVHERLKADDSDSGVTNIALEFGVANIGRFARSYQEMYGEKPSLTRRRGRIDRAKNQ